MTMRTAQQHTEGFVSLAGSRVHLLKGGAGRPLLVLHRDVGSPGWVPFYEELAQRFLVYAPSHPGFDKSERPLWMRSVRDLAIAYQWLLKDLKLDELYLLGLGFGGWVAAEMATMSHRQFKRLALVGSAGLQPTQGEILDQFLLNPLEYMKAGFHDEARLHERYGQEPNLDQLELWEINREMVTRIAWKPYMFSQTLPMLLKGVDVPTLIVWGREDRIIPLNCGERYREALVNARLEVLDRCGHFVELEKPRELAKLVLDFLTRS